MGIKGLAYYMRLQKDRVLKPFKLHNTRLVIDGDNIVFLLWDYFRIDNQCGGNYDVYAEKCRYFIDILRTCNVEPYVVFSGGQALDRRQERKILIQKRKRIQRIERMSEEGNGSIVSILAKKTFMNVLVEKDVPHVACEYEADREIAVLANRLECPVMSFDSDFYVFDLKAGYIPFNFLKRVIYSEGEDIGKFVPVKLYTVEAFKQDLASYVLPVLSCILGNDYVNGQEQLGQFYIQNSIALVTKYPESLKKRIRDILKWLEKQENMASCIDNLLQYVEEPDRESFKKVLKATIEEYCNTRDFEGIDLEDFFANYGNDINLERHANAQQVESSNSTTNVKPVMLPSWFRIAKTHCNIASALQDVALLGVVYKNCQVEVLTERSTYGCSKSIREITYAIILGQDSGLAVSEYDREMNNYVCFKVKPCKNLPGISSIPNLYTMPSITREERFSLLLASLELPHELLKNSMSDFSKYLIGLVTYWIRNSEPMVDKTHCYSALFGVTVLHARFFRNNTKLELRNFPKDFLTAFKTSTRNQLDDILAKTGNYFRHPNEFQKHRKDNYIVHAFAQFQVCLKESLQLNEVVMMPLKPPCPSLVLNTSFLYNCYRDLHNMKRQKRAMINILGDGSPVHVLFRDLLGCVEKVVDTFDRSMQQNRERGERSYVSSQRTEPQKTQKQIVKDFTTTNRFEALSGEPIVRNK